MEWIVIQNDYGVGFPNYLSLEDRIAYREIKVDQFLAKIKKKYPEMKVIKASALSSRIDLPYDIDADEFQTEFDCRIQ
ncbi:MAG: hypothetical protein HY225_00490 [Candidatus Vogelbacteria bacterium]|nr:hypothetical protein [Candidatus Vogelbacteria bacterium]